MPSISYKNAAAAATNPLRRPGASRSTYRGSRATAGSHSTAAAIAARIPRVAGRSKL